MLVAVVDLEIGSHVPSHEHYHEQVGIILEGELELTIGDETKIVKRGDVYVIPANVPHGAQAITGNVKLMDVFSPVREEYKY
jgi:quercetin dioxygenase-like cupin family protein